VIEERDIYRASHHLKGPERAGDRQAAMYHLEILGWVRPIGPGRQGKPNKWEVNPAVHGQRFAAVAVAERTRRSEVRELIAQAGAERREAA
jgi:hypothetical protein